MSLHILLKCQEVELNPSPKIIKPNLTITTFNCNGLGDLNKFRRILIKASNEVKNGGVSLVGRSPQSVCVCVQIVSTFLFSFGIKGDFCF